MGRLTYTNSENREVSVPIDANSPVATIGRSGECTISMNFASISRQHAQVYFDASRGRCAVCDLGSANGVLVNGSNVQTQELADGDDLMLGGFRLHFHEDQQAAALTGPVDVPQRPPQTEPPLHDEATYVFENPASTLPGSPYGPATVAPPGGGNGATQSAPIAAPQPTYQGDQRQQIAELEATIEQLRRTLATVEAERAHLQKSRSLEQQQLASLRQELQSAQTLSRELDGALIRAGKVLDPPKNS